jgi:hypothetical protein
MPSGGTYILRRYKDQVELQLMRNEEYVVARKYIYIEKKEQQKDKRYTSAD